MISEVLFPLFSGQREEKAVVTKSGIRRLYYFRYVAPAANFQGPANRTPEATELEWSSSSPLAGGEECMTDGKRMNAGHMSKNSTDPWLHLLQNLKLEFWKEAPVISSLRLEIGETWWVDVYSVPNNQVRRCDTLVL